MNRLTLIGLAALGAWVLVACAASQVLSISLDESSVDVVRGASAQVTVTVAGAGPVPVFLSVSGAPSNVSATLEPASLAAGATASTLTIDVARAAAEGTASLIVTAALGQRTAVATLSLSVESLTVNGTVVGLQGDGLPVVRVAIDGSTTTTDANGAFAMAGIAVPYDLVVYQTGAPPLRYGHLFVGLTTAAPTVMPGAHANTFGAPLATVEGALPAEVPPNHAVQVCAEGLDSIAFGCAQFPVSEGQGSFSLAARSLDGGSVGVRLHALEMALGDDGFPVAFTGYGTVDGALIAGDTVTLDVPPYTDPPEPITLQGSVAQPSELPNARLHAAVELSSTFSMRLFNAPLGATTSFDFPVPPLGDGTVTIVAATEDAGIGGTAAWRTGLAGTSDASLILPAPPVVVDPPDVATGVTVATTFSIGTTGGGATTFLFAEQGGTGTNFFVTTMSDTATIPDLGALGLPLPSGATFAWQVLQALTATSPEQAGVGWFRDFLVADAAALRGGPRPESDGAFAFTDTRAFTTN